MFTPEELQLIALSLRAKKDLCEVDLMMLKKGDTDTETEIKAFMIRIDTLNAKVKALLHNS